MHSKVYGRVVATTTGLALDNCCPAPPADPASLSVAQLARSVGVTPDTVRYYERVGLLPPPVRTRADHRRYDDTAADRLRFIQGAQRLGLRLREIKTLVEVRDTGSCPCQPAEVLLRQHITDVDAEIDPVDRAARRARGDGRRDLWCDQHPAGPELPRPDARDVVPTGADNGEEVTMVIDIDPCPCCRYGGCDSCCCSSCD